MHIVTLDVFAAAHGALSWPWIAIDPTSTRIAFASSDTEIATRVLAGGKVTAGPSFALPEGFTLPTKEGENGLRAFALSPASGEHGEHTCLALLGADGAASVVVTVDASGEVKRVALDGLVARAVAFDRTGAHLWISADGADESAIVLLHARSHEVLAVLRSPVFPPPALHELHVHPSDDAVLLLASCGEDGTFARVAGWSGGDARTVTLIPTALDGGDAPAGFVGFSADRASLHLAEAEALRTHAWPGLVELLSVPLDAEMVSSYAGVVLDHRVFVDGATEDDGEKDAVMIFDRTGLRGSRVKPPLPEGMWVGRLGSDGLVTVEMHGEPATGRVVRLPPPGN
jgi:hypothetical protein